MAHAAAARPPMMLAADVYDVAPATERGRDPAPARRRSMGRRLRLARARGGRPRAQPRRPRDRRRRSGRRACASETGLRRSTSAATARAGCSATRRPPTCAARGSTALITFGSPVDTRGALPFGLPEEIAERRRRGARRASSRTAPSRPGSSRTGFRLLDPMKSLRQRVDFVRQLHDREALLPRERQRRFLEGGRAGSPGRGRRSPTSCASSSPTTGCSQGGFVIEDRTGDAGRHRVPDPDRSSARSTRSPPRRRCARSPARRPAPTSTRWRFEPGTSGSSSARPRARSPGPPSPSGSHWRAERGRAAGAASRGIREQGPPPSEPAVGTGSGSGSGSQPGSAAGVVRALGGAASRTAPRGRGGRRGGHRPAPASGPARAPAPATQISLGLLLDEQAGRHPDADFFLFEDRAYTHADVKRARRQRRPRPALARRAPGRARRRADGDAPERARRSSRRSTGSARSRC